MAREVRSPRRTGPRVARHRRGAKRVRQADRELRRRRRGTRAPRGRGPRSLHRAPAIMDPGRGASPRQDAGRTRLGSPGRTGWPCTFHPGADARHPGAPLLLAAHERGARSMTRIPYSRSTSSPRPRSRATLSPWCPTPRVSPIARCRASKGDEPVRRRPLCSPPAIPRPTTACASSLPERAPFAGHPTSAPRTPCSLRERSSATEASSPCASRRWRASNPSRSAGRPTSATTS